MVVFQPQMLSECTIFHLFVNKNVPPYRFWNNKGWHVCLYYNITFTRIHWGLKIITTISVVLSQNIIYWM